MGSKMTTHGSRALAVGLTLLWGCYGCAPTQSRVARELQRFEGAQLYCEALQDVEYKTLEPGVACSTDIDHESQLYLFPTGKSYTVGFALPSTSQRYRLIVKSFAVGGHIDNSYIFYPEILILNESHEPIRTISSDNFQLVESGFWETATETGGVRRALQAEVDMDDEAGRYMLIYTPYYRLLQKSSTRTLATIPIALPGIVGVLPIGTREAHLSHAPVGHVKVEVFTRE